MLKQHIHKFKRRILWAMPFEQFITAAQPIPDRQVIEAYNKTGLAFIHIPKCAGTSIEMCLYNYSVKHRKWHELKKASPSDFDRWLKFAVIRDPIDRFISSFSYLSGGGRNPYDREFSRRIIRRRDISSFAIALSDPIERQRAFSWFHFCPQSQYVCNDDKLMVNRLFSFDRLDMVGEFIGRPLPRLNETPNRLQSDALNEEARLILHDLYSADFSLYAAIA